MRKICARVSTLQDIVGPLLFCREDFVLQLDWRKGKRHINVISPFILRSGVILEKNSSRIIAEIDKLPQLDEHYRSFS